MVRLLRFGLWLIAGFSAAAFLLPKLHLVPPTLTNANWQGRITYDYQVVGGPDVVSEEGTVNCGYFFDSYPYWEGDLVSPAGSLQDAADRLCDDVPGRLTKGVAPLRVFAILHNGAAGWSYTSSWRSEAEARLHLGPGDHVVRFQGPPMFGRLI